MTKSVDNKLDISLLYAEDEPLTRRLLCEILATKVRTVYQASNGREGLEMFRQYRPDVVLIDNNMPEMNGMRLSKAIQVLDPSAHIIIVSGDIKRDNLSQMEQMKLHYIKKPIRIRDLLELLQRVCTGVGLPPELIPRAYRVTSR